MMNGRTPAPVDADGALDFEVERPKATPPPSNNSAIIHVSFQGIPVDLQVSDKKIGQIEQLITGLLQRGWAAPPLPKTGGFGGRPDDRVDPAFDDQGNEICPVHKVKIREYKTADGRTFKGCPSKKTGAPGEKLNQRDYCSFRFK